MMRALARLWRDRRGVSAIEMGFIAPILMLMTVGFVDMGRIGFANSTIKNVAVQGARFAAVRGVEKPAPATQQDVIDFVKSRAAAIPGAELQVSVVWSPNNSRGSSVTVQVDYQYDALSLGFLPFGPFQLSATSTRTVS